MKGYKGFEPGLICRGKQYAENTVFEEDSAEICSKGMHFCENPFDVLDHYGFVGKNCTINDFAEVEALDEVHTDDNKKYCTKKLKIGAKVGISGLIKAFVEFTMAKVDFGSSAATNTGFQSAATNTGFQSAATNTGNKSAATNTGDYSAATVEGKESVATNLGVEGKAKGKIGCWITLAEWREDENYEWHRINVQTRKVDGETIKADVFYMLKDGEFVEVE